MSAADWDGQIAQLVPQNIEKIPLYHWKPGIRVLAVGSRDGAVFDDDIEKAEAHTFHRVLSKELLQISQEKMQTQGLCMNMCNSLRFPKNVGTIVSAVQGAVVLATPGFGDPLLFAEIKDRLNALQVLVSEHQAPLLPTLFEADCHIEVLVGIDTALPRLELPWEKIAAIHLCSLRPMNNADQRGQWYDQARSLVPDEIPVYDEDHTHSTCSCGEVLVWRSGGRSRLDALDVNAGACSACGASSTFVL